MNIRPVCFATLLVMLLADSALGTDPLPELSQVVAAPRDLWGEAAMKQPNGASYEFFAPLIPAPRYVHADFRYYPLVLSAPAAQAKARLISNGSGVNLRGGSRSWREVGTPVVFRVGPDEFRFGELRDRVSEPQLAQGWLPIYEITYQHPHPIQAEGLVPIDQRPVAHVPEVYRLEAFVSTEPSVADQAVVFVRFSLAAGIRGLVSVQLEPPAQSQFVERSIVNPEGKPVVLCDSHWKWERQGIHATLKAGSSATIAIPTVPLTAGVLKFDGDSYDQHRQATEKTWTEIVSRAMQVSVPERRVNNAWRNLLIQNLMLLNGERMFYSSGNQYEQLYEAEGSDAALTMLAWGFEPEARRMLPPLLDFTRRGLENHQAGIKLQNVVRYWSQTRDAAWVEQMRPRWERELNRVLAHRDQSGLLPQERYAGDISTPVHSLSVEAKVHRALRELPAMLRGIGDDALAARVERAHLQFEAKLMNALDRSVRHDTMPPFIPIALLSNESVHSPITATRIGSYWNLMMNYVIASRLFAPNSVQDSWIPHYLETHGGLCMGMTRSGGTAHGFWTGPDRVNPLYGTRYVVDALRRDDSERALVSFYGMLAQGFTRNTFVAGEGCTLAPVDDGGRFFYCPPNSAGNAHWLTMLRNLLVQDFDLDNDGTPETLRLLFATSRRWLDDGNQITVERAPTAFGLVSVHAESQLQKGQIVVRVSPPTRSRPQQLLLRARVPDGWQVTSASIGEGTIPVDHQGTVDLTHHSGELVVNFAVERKLE